MPEFADLFEASTDEPVAQDAPVRTRRPRSDKGQPRGARGTGGTSTRDKKLAADLLNPWAKGIKAVAYPLPTLAAVMTAQGETTMTALVAIASPKMKEALTKAAKVGPGADLLEAVAMMVIAALMDIGKVRPESPIAAFSGVQEFFDLTHTKTEVPDNVSPFPGPPQTGFAPYPGA